MEEFCRKIAYYSYKKELVEEDNIEDLRFLIELILTQLVTIISVYLIGLFFVDALDILMICIYFVAGRKYLDGYHASTFRNCYILTIINFIFSLSMALLMPYLVIFYLIGLILSIYLMVKYRYKKIIIFNLVYLIINFFSPIVVNKVNTVNYFVIILMRLIRREELDDCSSSR